MFKIHNKNTSFQLYTGLVAYVWSSFWCFYFELWTYFLVFLLLLWTSKCKLGFYLFLLKLRNHWLVGVSFQKETVTVYSPSKLEKYFSSLSLWRAFACHARRRNITQSPIIFTRNIFSRMIFCVIWRKCIKFSWNQLSPEFWKDWIYQNA